MKARTPRRELNCWTSENSCGLGLDDRTGSGGMRRSLIRYVSISMGIGYRGVGDVITFLCALHAHDGPWIWVV